MTISGTGGNDRLRGTNGIDDFDASQGGKDHVEARDGDDTIRFGAALTNRDKIDGGDGFDTLTLDGDYSAGVRLRAATLTGVEVVALIGGHSYNFTMAEDNALAGADFRISGSSLLATDVMIVDASADTDVFYLITGGAGDDILTGGTGGASFGLHNGGADTATSTGGLGLFNLGGAFDAADVLRGSADTDFVTLGADYSAGLHITQSMMQDMDVVQMGGAFGYNITIDNRVIDAGESMTFDGRNIEAAFSLIFDGSAERDSRLFIEGGQGDDTVTGGDGEDSLLMYDGGHDVANGGKGDDIFQFQGTFERDDEVDGGADYDTLDLGGDYSAGLVFRSHTVRQIEEIHLAASGHDYSLTTADQTVAAGATLTVDGNAIGANVLVFDGSAEADGMFNVTGSVGADTLTGGLQGDVLRGGDGDDHLNGFQGNDILTGGLGIDRLNGGLGADIYVVTDMSQSTGAACDITTTFNAAVDKFDLGTSVTGIDTKIIVGTLSEGSFDTDMATAVNSGNLAIGHAVLFDPDGGDLSSHLYLIVEANGNEGYQAGSDYVFRVDNAINMNALATTNFI